ncbi:MAG: hypothetical protein ACRCTR_02520 [Actinomycetota bacterium]
MTQSDDVLRDEPLEREITLVGDLVIAATQHDGPLTDAEIDEALGVPDGDIPTKSIDASGDSAPTNRAPKDSSTQESQ